MKVLLVTNMYPHKEGPYYGIFVKEQIEAICRWHPDVEFAVEFVNGTRNKLGYVKSIPKIIQRVKNEKFDLIHVHYGFSGLFLLFMRRIKIPVLVTLHGGDILIDQGKTIQVFFTKLILKRADAVIILNDRMRKVVEPLTRLVYSIPCAVDAQLFHPLEKIGSSEEKKLVFPSDRNRWVKDYPLFERVVKILAEKYGLRCVTYEVKNMSREQVAALYQSADLMLMTSISEGSPQVVKEAMACNLPVVSTNVGDVAYLLEGVKGSAVVAKRNPEELAGQCYASLTGCIVGQDGREKLFQLGLDEKNTSYRIYRLYQNLTERHIQIKSNTSI